MIPRLREMIGKPLLAQAIEFNNTSPMVLEALTPDGARFFYGGNSKTPGQTADDLRLNKAFSLAMTPCQGAHDLGAKIASAIIWQTLGENQNSNNSAHIALGLEQLLALMNNPPGVVTPSTLRAPRAITLRGPVFEYVRGDTTEVLTFVNEGVALRISWSISNSAVCPR